MSILKLKRIDEELSYKGDLMKSPMEMTDDELRSEYKRLKRESELQNVLQEALKVLN